jgi:hypothetical protein
VLLLDTFTLFSPLGVCAMKQKGNNKINCELFFLSCIQTHPTTFHPSVKGCHAAKSQISPFLFTFPDTTTTETTTTTTTTTDINKNGHTFIQPPTADSSGKFSKKKKKKKEFNHPKYITQNHLQHFLHEQHHP